MNPSDSSDLFGQYRTDLIMHKGRTLRIPLRRGTSLLASYTNFGDFASLGQSRITTTQRVTSNLDDDVKSLEARNCFVAMIV